MVQASDSKRGAFMVFQVLGYVAGILLVSYLAFRCLGGPLTSQYSQQRRWMFEQVRLHHEQVAEYERRKAAGEQVGPPPRMPGKVAALLYLSPVSGF